MLYKSLFTSCPTQASTDNVLTEDRLSMSALGKVLSSKLVHAELVPLMCGAERERVCGQALAGVGVTCMADI